MASSRMSAAASSRKTPPVLQVGRADVLAFRWHAHQLDREPASAHDRTDVAILDLGVQNTGPDGAAWGLAVRGVEASAARWTRPDDTAPARDGLDPDLSIAWTLRGAPHAYRRTDLRSVAVATAPYSEADASKRVFTASKPLRDAGIPVLDALRTEAEREREIVTRPTPKGELSTQLTRRLDDPYLRWCRTCGATHSYEMTFRLAALQAGLELLPGTSPPVLRRIPRFRAAPYARLAPEADPRFDVVRGYLRFFGPATVKEVAAYVDAPVKDVRAHWPDDVAPVAVSGTEPQERWVLAEDVDHLSGARDGLGGGAVRLVGPFDPYLQLRDRATLVGDQTRAKDVWRTLGRPGAVLADGEVVGTWRPRTAATRLTVRVDAWVPFDAALTRAVAEQAARLGAFRGVEAEVAGTA